MHETSKCYDFRKARGDFANFLKGSGIDIGCGPDPLKVEEGSVRPWDLNDGDAQLMPGVPDGEFDFVYSSHCLEHMRDVRESLTNWLRILKPGGFLYVVVPDYILYEKLTWPSRYNIDHKNSFSFMITRGHVQRPNHWHMNQDMFPLLTELGAEPLRMTVEDNGFNYNAGVYDQTRFDALAQMCVVAKKK
jgi:SAM-dependent methyltransferase